MDSRTGEGKAGNLLSRTDCTWQTLLGPVNITWTACEKRKNRKSQSSVGKLSAEFLISNCFAGAFSPANWGRLLTNSGANLRKKSSGDSCLVCLLSGMICGKLQEPNNSENQGKLWRESFGFGFGVACSRMWIACLAYLFGWVHFANNCDFPGLHAFSIESPPPVGGKLGQPTLRMSNALAVHCVHTCGMS